MLVSIDIDFLNDLSLLSGCQKFAFVCDMSLNIRFNRFWMTIKKWYGKMLEVECCEFYSSFNWTWIKSCVSCNIAEFIDGDEIKWYVLMYLDHAISIFCLLEVLIHSASKTFYESKAGIFAINLQIV